MYYQNIKPSSVQNTKIRLGSSFPESCAKNCLPSSVQQYWSGASYPDLAVGTGAVGFALLLALCIRLSQLLATGQCYCQMCTDILNAISDKVACAVVIIVFSAAAVISEARFRAKYLAGSALWLWTLLRQTTAPSTVWIRTLQLALFTHSQ